MCGSVAAQLDSRQAIFAQQGHETVETALEEVAVEQHVPVEGVVAYVGEEPDAEELAVVGVVADRETF